MEKYIDKIVSQGEKIVEAIIIIVIGFIIYKLVNRVIEKMIEKAGSNEIILNFCHTITKIIFVVAVILTALSQLGVNITSLLAMFTAAAAALALALKETLGDVVAGMKILFTKPFVKDDYIEINDIAGRIQEISLFYTFVMTVDNKKIVIPNSVMANNIFINYTSEEKHRIEMEFEVDYDSDIELVKNILHDVVLQDDQTLKNEKVVTRLQRYNDSSITILVKSWINIQDFEEIGAYKGRINELAFEEFRKHNVKIPFPQVEISQRIEH